MPKNQEFLSYIKKNNSHYLRAAPSRRVARLYLRGHRPRYARHLEATATLRSPYTQKIALKVNFPRFFLYLCVFFCTFEHLPVGSNSYLVMLKRIFQHSLVATFASCSPYSRYAPTFCRKIRLRLIICYPSPHS